MIKPVADIQHLVSLIDGIVGSRPRLPALVIAMTSEDATAREFIEGYHERLSDSDGNPLVPQALGTGTALANALGNAKPDVAVLDELAGQLLATIPSGAGKWRPRLFQTCLGVLNADGIDAGATNDAKRRKLRDHLYAEWEARTPWLAWIERFDAAGGFPHVLSLIANTVLSGPLRFWFGRRLNRKRLRWFGAHVRKVNGLGGDFLSHALRLAPSGELHSNLPLRRRILLDALIRDIERFVKRGLFFPRRRRRRWTPVLALDCTTGLESPCFDLVQLLADLIKEKRKSPLLVLAAVQQDELRPAVSSPESVSTSIADAIDHIRGFVNGRPSALPSQPWQPVLLPSGPTDPGANAWLTSHQKVTPIPPGPVSAWAPVVLTTVGTLAAATLTAYTYLTSGCADTWTNDLGERVGVIEKDCEFTPDQAAAGPSLRELQTQVIDNNNAVDAMRDATGEPRDYREVVFFAPLTRPNVVGRTAPINGLWQLQGAVDAQRNVNEAALVDSSTVPIKLVLANSGDNFKDGPEVASVIAERQKEGPGSLAAVIGISQSRQESLDAFDRLKDVAVIASSMYGNKMTDGNNNVFLASPPDDAFAEKMAQWVIQRRYTDAVIVYDDTDTYFSKDLRDSLRNRLQGRLNLRDEELGEQTSLGDKPLNALMRELCQDATNGKIPIFAGRADQLRRMLTEGNEIPECRDNDIPMLAGPGAIIDIASGNVSKYPWLDLTYTVLADKTITNEETAASSDEATGYDALAAASEAINRAEAANGNNAGGVLFQLNQAGFSINGKSGQLTFAPRQRKDPSPDRIRVIRARPS